MKNTFDDTSLTKAAKGLVQNMAQQYSPEKVELSQIAVSDNTVDIKVAKAKAGARRHINRTIRICAVAAVLMIGLVCALFMGADEVKLPPAPEPINFDITYDAYMWKNNSTDPAENMPVKVRIIVEETDLNRIDNPTDLPNTPLEERRYEPAKGKHGTVIGRYFNITIMVSDLEGNIVRELYAQGAHKQDAVPATSYKTGVFTEYVPYVSYNTELPLNFEYTEMQRAEYDEEKNLWVELWPYKPLYQINIDISEDFSSFEIFLDYTLEDPALDEGLEALGLSELEEGKLMRDGKTNYGGVWSHRDAIFITSGATTREEAIARRYEIAEEKAKTITERTGQTTGFLFDRLKNKVWK
jgi:hypothetical protein